AKVRFKVTVPEDEIDFESGFLIAPQAIPVLVTEPGGPGGPATPPPTPPGSGPGEQPPPDLPPQPPLGGQRHVDLCFIADRQQLYTAWQAIANLADMAGNVTITIHAESEGGFDRSKLQNGVLEPLEEAGLVE
ncbi:MAG: hypothetical protein JW820_20815, partial [Spirochaetales bacterium]|nr:hypothetical protein [Spirochaetales bacterium]